MGLETVDVVVVGGGPAGLSAALILGRSRRRVLVCDSGRYRNAASHAMHAFLSRDGTDPAELRRVARAELATYDGVHIRDVTVVDAQPVDGGFLVTLEGGERVRCRKLLLATGVVDELPTFEGFDAVYGRSAFHCPYCDGWEWRDQPLAVYGCDGARARALALELLGWSSDLVVVSDGPSDLGAEARAELAALGVGLDERPIARLEHEDGRLRAVRFRDGAALPRAALFFATPERQRCELPGRLGVEFDRRGAVATHSYERTCVPGLYVAGDASRRVDLVIVAAAEGALAGFAINGELLREDRAERLASRGFVPGGSEP